MTLEELTQLDGVVAAWHWKRDGGSPEVYRETGSIDKEAADLVRCTRK
jgi:roadblock/LC7 domain-containing protein